MSVHYFLGIGVPEYVQADINADSREMFCLPSFKKLTHPADYHITLKFLGTMTDTERIRLEASAIDIANATQPFPVQMLAAQNFGQPLAPRVLFAGVELTQSLQDLQKKIEHASAQLGFQHDHRPYKPHVTIAKQWRGEQRFSNEHLELTKKWEKHQWKVTSFHLYEVKREQTPRYNILRQFQLMG